MLSGAGKKSLISILLFLFAAGFAFEAQTVTMVRPARPARSGGTTLFELTISPSSIDLGNVALTQAVSQTFTITNVSTVSGKVNGYGVSGPGFSFSAGALPVSLAAGKTTTVTVTFAPPSEGTVIGSLTVFSTALTSPDTAVITSAGVTTPGGHVVDLHWDASTSTVAGYNVARGIKSGGPYTKLTSVPIPCTKFTDANVVAGTKYFYVVTAVDALGKESGISTEISIIIPSP